MLNALRRDLLSRRPMPIRWSISQPQTDEHRVWVQCSHLAVSVNLWVLTLGTGQASRPASSALGACAEAAPDILWRRGFGVEIRRLTKYKQGEDGESLTQVANQEQEGGANLKKT